MGMGYMDKVLDVNLTTGKWISRPLDSEYSDLYLGGKGIGARLLYDESPAQVEPLSEEAVLIFSTGPVTGTGAPQSNRFVVTGKSPLTYGIGNSTCGGNFATKLKRAGYDVLIVRGKAKKPVYLDVTPEAVVIKDATHLWGKGTHETQELLPKMYGKAVIGPAGENLVRYACIMSEHRAAGRTGLGAVMGSKNLKAIIANGNEKVDIAYEEQFKEYRKNIIDYLAHHPICGNLLPRLGTANLLMTTAGKNILPTRNFKMGSHMLAHQVSGEEMAAHYLVKQDGCLACPIRCGRQVKYEGKITKGPEYETLGLFSANLCNFDITKVFEAAEACDDMGLDTISAAGVLGFTMELTERKMFKSHLKFGRNDNLVETIQAIAHRDGIGKDLAEGVSRMSQKFGGHEFAIHVKGLELPAYDPRGCYGQGLEYATTNRGGCHICGGTMFMEATGPINIDPLSILAKPELVVFQQNLNAGISSMVMCFFSAYAVIPNIMFELSPNGLLYKILMRILLNSGPALNLMLKTKLPIPLNSFEKFCSLVLGRSVSMGEFNEIGERVFNMERLYNIREGKTAKDDDLPPRLTDESIFEGTAQGVPIHKMLPKYYGVRGWDKFGIPTLSTRKRLKIRD